MAPSRLVLSTARALAIVDRLGSLALEIVAPPACAACDEDVPSGRVFCLACAQTVVRRPPRGDAGDERALAPFVFGGAIAEAVRRLKYGRRPDLARPLGHLLRAAAVEARLEADLVAQVPLHPRRRADRGYDQAGLLARHVAAALARPHRPGALRRLRHGAPQASLGRDERLRNEALAFSADARVVGGARVLLVDDVITTGATARACRQAALAAGAREVDVLCVARADAPG